MTSIIRIIFILLQLTLFSASPVQSADITPLELFEGANKYETEASGNINDKNILDYAKTGVNRISIGRLTHSPQNLDISLNFN